MTDQNRDAPGLLDTPIMPTGSGVADLETARELDGLAQDGAITTETDAIENADVAPMTDDADVRERESRPS